MSLVAPPHKVPIAGATGLIGGLLLRGLLADVTHFDKVDDLSHVCADLRRPETLTKSDSGYFRSAPHSEGVSWRGVPPMAEHSGAACITARTRRLDSISLITSKECR